MTTVTKKQRPGLSAILNQSKDDQDTSHKFFNLKKVIDLTKIQPDKIYNNMRGDYDSLTLQDRKNIAAVLIPNVKKFFEKLGYLVTITPIK